MRCPSCGTLVDDGLDLCPACHAALGSDPHHTQNDVLWCESCGSAIPQDRDTCPVCGMPVASAFDDMPAEEEPREDDANELVSAIPPDPTEKPDELQVLEDRRRRIRYLFVAACAALLIVGGGTLAITRPWDPNAYTIHATADADTSMEGFPGTVTHLSSQDRIENAVWESYLSDVEDFLNGFRERMWAMSLEADVLYESLPGMTSVGDISVVHDRAREVSKLRSELADTSTLATRLVLPNVELDKERDNLLVLSTYLRGELEILDKAWQAADSANDIESAGTEARIAVQRASRARDFSEWRNLFKNAYETTSSSS